MSSKVPPPPLSNSSESSDYGNDFISSNLVIGDINFNTNINNGNAEYQRRRSPPPFPIIVDLPLSESHETIKADLDLSNIDITSAQKSQSKLQQKSSVIQNDHTIKPESKQTLTMSIVNNISIGNTIKNSTKSLEMEEKKESENGISSPPIVELKYIAKFEKRIGFLTKVNAEIIQSMKLLFINAEKAQSSLDSEYEFYLKHYSTCKQKIENEYKFQKKALQNQLNANEQKKSEFVEQIGKTSKCMHTFKGIKREEILMKNKQMFSKFDQQWKKSENENYNHPKYPCIRVTDENLKYSSTVLTQIECMSNYESFLNCQNIEHNIHQRSIHKMGSLSKTCYPIFYGSIYNLQNCVPIPPSDVNAALVKTMGVLFGDINKVDDGGIRNSVGNKECRGLNGNPVHNYLCVELLYYPIDAEVIKYLEIIEHEINIQLEHHKPFIVTIDISDHDIYRYPIDDKMLVVKGKVHARSRNHIGWGPQQTKIFNFTVEN